MGNRVFGAYADSDSEGSDQIRAFLSGPSQSSRFTDYCRIYLSLYSRLSLPRLRLSRDTAYLEVKPGPCFNMEI